MRRWHAHAAEQPAAGWDNEGLAPEDVPAGTSRQDTSPADATTDAGARERAAAHRREDAQVFLTDVPRGTFIRGPSRTVRRADALAWMAERMFESGRCTGACTGPPRNRGPCRSRRARRRPGGTLRNRAPHRHRGGDRPAAVLRRRHRPCGGWCERRAAERRAPHPQHSAGGASCALKPRPRVPLPRLPRHPPAPRPSRQALGQRRGDLPRQPHPPVSDPSPAGARGRIRRVQRLDDGAFRFTNPHGLAIRPPKRPETSSPDTIVIQNESLGLAIDCETAHGALARRAHRLRPCVDGDDGVMGFGRHPTGGGTGGRRLESVVDESGWRVP